jgi:hypothetical protein
MDTSDDEGKQINLSHREAADLAFQATQDDADSLILLLLGIKEHRSPIEIDLLIDSAVTELVRNSSVYIELRDEYMRILISSGRSKEPATVKCGRLASRGAARTFLYYLSLD